MIYVLIFLGFSFGVSVLFGFSTYKMKKDVERKKNSEPFYFRGNRLNAILTIRYFAAGISPIKSKQISSVKQSAYSQIIANWATTVMVKLRERNRARFPYQKSPYFKPWTRFPYPKRPYFKPWPEYFKNNSAGRVFVRRISTKNRSQINEK